MLKQLVMRELSKLKGKHDREIKKLKKKLTLAKKETERTRKKYKELQKKHQKLHVLNSKLKRQVTLHEQTLIAIGNSIKTELDESPTELVEG